jgi:hypothetical protein
MIYNFLIKKGTFIPRLKRLGILIVWLVSSHILQAEELGVEELNPGNGEAAVPIDGGASLLLAAAAGLGAYRLKRQQKEGKTKRDNS